eukprot:1153050-Pelagomonas_calceolata.AAC.9
MFAKWRQQGPAPCQQASPLNHQPGCPSSLSARHHKVQHINSTGRALISSSCHSPDARCESSQADDCTPVDNAPDMFAWVLLLAKH